LSHVARVRSFAAVIILFSSVNAFGQGATQASITGVVRDGSGAVLPGVTVEALPCVDGLRHAEAVRQ
jgi:hypothetical protein